MQSGASDVCKRMCNQECVCVCEPNTYLPSNYGKRCKAPPHAVRWSAGSGSECGLDSDSRSELERAVEWTDVLVLFWLVSERAVWSACLH